MLVVTAPTTYDARMRHTTIFLAGGISKCWEWQQACLDEIERLSKEKNVNTDNMIIYNPRRPCFKHDAKVHEVQEQVQWEYYYLEQCDIFSMYFCESESAQPICMYELGRNVAKKSNNMKVASTELLSRPRRSIPDISMSHFNYSVLLAKATVTK